MIIQLCRFMVLALLLTSYCLAKSDIQVGHQVSLSIPTGYDGGFIGRAFLMEANQVTPSFRAALSVEAMNGNYSCSLQVFLGDVKVWDSGHFSQFYTSEKCELELSYDGDLRLKGPKGRVGWKTGTSGQGVERLQMLETGNLVLVDKLNGTKWQSFNFPTNIMLWGQTLDVATRLTSFIGNPSSFYSFEVQNNKVRLFLNSGKLSYSYWEFMPSKERNLSFVKLGSSGLEIFNDKYKKIAQIPSQGNEPLKFLALNNETGNLGLYFYSPDKAKFEVSFQALNSTCDLPISCKPYGICTFSNACSCIKLLTEEINGSDSDCSGKIPIDFCGGNVTAGEMLELEGVSTVLKGAPKMVNISIEACVDFCLEDCKCVAALYNSEMAAADTRECYLYRIISGVRQVEKGSDYSFMIKVPQGFGRKHGQSGLKRWILIVVAAVDSVIIVVVVGGVGYWFLQKWRKASSLQSQSQSQSAGTGNNTTT